MSVVNILPNIKFILDEYVSHLKTEVGVTLLRSDGVVLYASRKDTNVNTSVGALSAGVWQAALSLLSIVGTNHKEDYNLQFSSSSDGIALYPVTIGKEDCFLVGIYQNLLNPGPVKQSLKLLSNKLSSLKVSGSENLKINNLRKDGFLFGEITDEEMDTLFSI